jgi:transcriptional regulator with XRE-family HTH domain
MKLVELRASRALSIRELAKLAGVSPGTVYGVEHGDVVPAMSTVRKLAEVLDVEPPEVEEFQVAIDKTIRGKETALTTK